MLLGRIGVDTTGRRTVGVDTALGLRVRGPRVLLRLPVVSDLLVGVFEGTEGYAVRSFCIVILLGG